jgi:uncharacterized Fe-S cluster protein YjdI
MASRIKDYEGEEIVVGYEIARCMHAARCVKELPEVFDVSRKPWVLADGAPAERVAQQVARCPSGALTVRRPSGESLDPTPDEARIEVSANGPLYVSGAPAIVDADGDVVTDDRRVALCRCGASENKPFCDGTHAKVGFSTN